MATSKSIRAVSFSKQQSTWWLCLIAFYVVLFVYDLYREENFFLGHFDHSDWAVPLGFGALIWASQWNMHCLRVLRAEDHHVRIEGDKIIAFGRVFPKGPQDHIVFEKCGGAKLGYWATLRNGDEEMHIPLFAYRSAEEYVDAPDPEA